MNPKLRDFVIILTLGAALWLVLQLVLPSAL